MARSRLLLPPLVLGVLGLVAVSCGASGYQYVENDDFGVFAKIPDGWETFDQDQLRLALADVGQVDVETQQRLARTWFRGFDSSDDPSVRGTFDTTASEPRGFVQIQALTPTEREQINLTALRGFDSIAAQTGASSNVDLRVDEPADFEGGYHGVHTVYVQNQGDLVGIVDKTAVLDSTNSFVVTFVIACNPRCYDETHHDEIAAIVDSWTIQEGT